MQFIAIDWSGNASAAARFTAIAVVRSGNISSVETGRSGSTLADHVEELAGLDPQTVVGLDFAFSLPAWYLRERGFDDVRALWRAAGAEGEQWLRGTGPFWGRPGIKKPALREHFRRTDLAVPAVGGITPKSVFQVGGAGAVGTGSVRGMPFLLGLVERGFHVWPFEGGWPLVVEIYPRILTGPVVKSSAAARRDYLRDPRWRLDGNMLSIAAATEDTFDAAVSTLVMAEHADELRALEPATDPQTLLEGAIWFPTSVPVELPDNVELPHNEEPMLTDRFEQALVFAAHEHRDQTRKGSDLPYLGHLLGVASLVLEEGGDEDQAIAALLHDAVEDQGGLPMLEQIRDRFGERVASIVYACTDAVTIPKPPWRKRKEDYLEHLKSAPPEVLLVSVADKLFNARSILQDYSRVGPAVWDRFNPEAGATGQLWYYSELVKAFNAAGDRVSVVLARELDRVVAEIERLHQQTVPAESA